MVRLCRPQFLSALAEFAGLDCLFEIIVQIAIMHAYWQSEHSTAASPILRCSSSALTSFRLILSLRHSLYR